MTKKKAQTNAPAVQPDETVTAATSAENTDANANEADNSNGGATAGEELPIVKEQPAGAIAGEGMPAEEVPALLSGAMQLMAQLPPETLTGLAVRYHDNGANSIRQVLPAQMLQKNKEGKDILVVFNSTQVLELTASYIGDVTRNTNEPYWSMPGMDM